MDGTVQSERTRVPAGQSMASLQIAVGIWGLLLLILPIVFTWRRSLGGMAAALALVAGVLLPFVGGIIAKREDRQARAANLMLAGDALLTVGAITMLVIGLHSGSISWSLTLGPLFLVLAIFSDMAVYRFRRQVNWTP
jgi:LytS/YehU family sensor histidine kinase